MTPYERWLHDKTHPRRSWDPAEIRDAVIISIGFVLFVVASSVAIALVVKAVLWSAWILGW
jgi:hypothetical protein